MVYIEIIHPVITLSLVVYIYYLTKKQKQFINVTNTEFNIVKDSLEVLMCDLNNYQVKTETKTRDLEKLIDYNHKATNRKFENTIKDLPITIRKIIGHIEFARPLDKR
jgi:hypothetical protein